MQIGLIGAIGAAEYSNTQQFRQQIESDESLREMPGGAGLKDSIRKLMTGSQHAVPPSDTSSMVFSQYFNIITRVPTQQIRHKLAACKSFSHVCGHRNLLNFLTAASAAISDMCVTESDVVALTLKGFCLRSVPMLVTAVAERAVGKCNVALLRDALLHNYRDDAHLLAFQKMLYNGIVNGVDPKLVDGFVKPPEEYKRFSSWIQIEKVNYILFLVNVSLDSE